MIYSLKQIEAEMIRLGYVIPTGLHLVGVRSRADKPNQFDDMLYLIIKNSSSAYRFYSFTGTTNPGTHWLANLLNPNGAFVLKPGQYIDCWKLGKHKGLYDAWVQVKPVTGYRDGNKDSKIDTNGKLFTGLFGINVHRASESRVSQLIDKWSAGCQVLNNPDQYNDFINESKNSRQEFFTYTLLDEW